MLKQSQRGTSSLHLARQPRRHLPRRAVCLVVVTEHLWQASPSPTLKHHGKNLLEQQRTQRSSVPSHQQMEGNAKANHCDFSKSRASNRAPMLHLGQLVGEEMESHWHATGTPGAIGAQLAPSASS